MASVATTRAARSPSQGQGRGRVLTAAFGEAENQPVLSETRDRILELLHRGAPAGDIAAVVESDVGMTIAIVRAGGTGTERVSSVPEVVERLGSAGIEATVAAAPAYELFNGDGERALAPDRFRLHALTVQRAADRIAELVGMSGRDELALAAILHDVGRPVLARLHPGYAERFDRHSAPPDERISAERRELGIDHALVGGVLARRWGVQASVAEAIERHHSEKATGAAAVIRAADMIAAHLEDCPVNLNALEAAADACALGAEGVRRVLFELPQGKGARPRSGGPCPLSARELEVLRRLAEGKVYKQIAQELNLSASTVRSHLHNVYGKLGALDRAQAVLIATARGWI